MDDDGTLLPYLLAGAATVASRWADAALRPYGVTTRQFGLLTQLQREPELSASEIARQLGVSRQSTHEMIGQLEQAGYLRRAAGVDGRSRRIDLTPNAPHLISRMSAAVGRVERRLTADLGDHEREALRLLLRRVLARATDDEAWLPTGGAR